MPQGGKVIERSRCRAAADEPDVPRLGEEMIPAPTGSAEQNLQYQANKLEAVTVVPSQSSPANPAEPGIVAAANPPSAEYRGIYWVLRRLGNRWTIPILSALRDGPVRFAKLKRSLDSVSQRMLTLSLRRLERDGLIFREEIAGQPPQVRYSLTPLGVALVERLDDFEHWLAAQGKVPHPED